MEVLTRGRDFAVWGDPRAGDWTPGQIMFDPALHGTRLGAVMNQLTRRSGLALRRCREAGRHCELTLYDPAADALEVHLVIAMTAAEALAGDIERSIALALRQYGSPPSWPTPAADAGLDADAAFDALAHHIAEHLRRTGIQLVPGRFGTPP